MKYCIRVIPLIFILLISACTEEDQIVNNRIKPEFASTYLGGKGHEFCEAIAVDDAGNIYVAGNTRSLNFPTTEGTYNREPKGKSDVFIAKFDNDLETLIASTLIGGKEDECAYTILFDSQGYVYVAGYTSSEDFPTTEQAYDKNYNGGDGDAFILKMDKDLKDLVSSTYLGGSSVEDDWRSPEMVQDGHGNIYIAGITDSKDFPTTPGVFQQKYSGGTHDVFLSKFDSDLKELIASTLLGGSNDDRMGRSLCIDFKNDEICAGGYTFSPDFPTSENAYGRAVSGQLDGFVLKLTMDLTSMTSSTILNGGWIYCMMIHDNGDIYVGGHANNVLPTTSRAFYQDFNQTTNPIFISRFSNNLSKLKSSTLLPGIHSGASRTNIALNLIQTHDGHILSSGWAISKNFPITPGVYDETHNGNGDTYILKMNKHLSKVLLSTFIGGSRSERWNRMITDGTGTIYIASHSLSSDFPTTKGAAFEEFSDVINDEEENQNTSPRDAFVIRIDENLSAEVFEEFHEAAKKGNLKIIKQLLSQQGELLEKRDKYRRTALHSATKYGAVSAAKYLIEKGANLNSGDENGDTPLHLASMYCHERIVELMVNSNADINAVNDDGDTPLSLATIYGTPKTLGLLLSNGADRSIRDKEGNTILHIASLNRQFEKVQEIMKYQPEVDSRNKAGNTPLHLVVRFASDEQQLIEYLLDHGASISATDSTGKSALHIASTPNTKLLIKRGANTNLQDRDGNTPLHSILINVLRYKFLPPTWKEKIEMLIEVGADLNIKNKKGKSPLDLAIESGVQEAIDLLKISK